MIYHFDNGDFPVRYVSLPEGNQPASQWVRHVGMPLDATGSSPRCVPALTGMTRDVFRQLANMPGNSRQTTREKSADFGDKGVNQE